MIQIPYVPQRGNRPKNDCGPACVLMFARAFGKCTECTVEEISLKIDPEDDGTTLWQLRDWLSSIGLTPITSSIRPGYPYIALVEYRLLPNENKSDPSGNFRHWIVRLGPTTYHDPYHFGDRGAYMSAKASALDAAELNAYLTLKEFKEMPGAYARIPYGRRYLIAWTGDQRWPQYAPSTSEQLTLLEAYRRKNRFTLGDSFDDAGLDVVTRDGQRGTVHVELWGWPKDGAVRAAYEAFFREHYPHAIVLFKDFSELEAGARPPIYELSVSPTQVEKGSEVEVSWRVENVAEAHVAGVVSGSTPIWHGITGPTGKMKWPIVADTQIVLRIRTPAGSELTRRIDVKALDPVLPAPIYDLSVQPAQVAYGGAVTVSWHVENVKAAYLNGEGVTGPKGSRTYSGLTGDTIFVLSVILPNGTERTRSLTVKVAPYQPPPPPPSGRQAIAGELLGWNVIDQHRFAEVGYQAGARAFLWMEGHLGAKEFKDRHPDAIVIYRAWLDQTKYGSGQELVARIGQIHRGLIYMGYNEADSFGQGGDDLARRLQQDVEAAKIVKAAGGFWIAGTFSMGTPDFTNPDVCRIIREIAAPAYNSGLMGFDMHLYSPNMDHIFRDANVIWFERRWEWLFTHCGFDPRVRAIYCTETGLDEGGVGGFPAHNVSDDYLYRWCKRWLEVSRRPLFVAGVSYPSPLVAACVFQAGQTDGRWAGYEVSRYLSVWQRVWGEN